MLASIARSNEFTPAWAQTSLPKNAAYQRNERPRRWKLERLSARKRHRHHDHNRQAHEQKREKAKGSEPERLAAWRV